jgi:hypothetical protein
MSEVSYLLFCLVRWRKRFTAVATSSIFDTFQTPHPTNQAGLAIWMKTRGMVNVNTQHFFLLLLPAVAWLGFVNSC